MSKRTRRPSPSMIVAVAALIVAVAGTAVATPLALTALTKKEKKQTRKIANEQISRRAPGLSVASANSANTANSATQAQNANTANGVKPIKVSFAAPSGTPATAFVDEGGVRISGECTALGDARLELTNTGAGGALVQFVTVNGAGTTFAAPNLGMGSGTSQAISTGAAPFNILTVTVTYRGAAGTEVSGDLVIARGAVAAQCVFAGTLLVG
jgi:hypothetical protein